MIPLAFLEGSSLFIASLFDEPVFFFSVVMTVVLSVTLHELGHAWAAVGQGDETPRLAGRMTLDPLVHMGPFSLVALLLVGIAWGSTPVNPTRFRSRHGEAWVSFAGPAVNLVLAFLGLTALALWLRAAGPVEGDVAANVRLFLLVFGTWNLILFAFNMLPVPPLDGSTVLGDFVPAFGKVARDPNNQGAFLVVFLAIFFFAGELFSGAFTVAHGYIDLVAGR